MFHVSLGGTTKGILWWLIKKVESQLAKTNGNVTIAHVDMFLWDRPLRESYDDSKKKVESLLAKTNGDVTMADVSHFTGMDDQGNLMMTERKKLNPYQRQRTDTSLSQMFYVSLGGTTKGILWWLNEKSRIPSSENERRRHHRICFMFHWEGPPRESYDDLLKKLNPS